MKEEQLCQPEMVAWHCRNRSWYF